MRKRTQTNSNGDFFTTESLVTFPRIVKKTIKEYTDELQRRCSYKSTVGQVLDGTIMDDRSRLIDLYDACYVENAHLKGVLETLYSMLTGDRYMLGRMNDKGKWERDCDASRIVQGTQFEKIIKGILDAKMYGYTLLEISNETDGETGRLREVNIIERRNILPDQRRVIKRQHQWDPGWNLDSEQYKHNYVLINNGDFGLFSTTTPLILAQKYTLSNWVNFSHTYGQPIIHGKTGAEDNQSRQRLASKIASAAQNKVLVTGKDDEIDIKAFTMSNSEKIYDNLIAYTNSEISNLILGSESMAGKTQAYVGSAKSHEEVLRARTKTYRTYIENVVNEKILPVLKYWSLIPEDVWFVYSNQVDMSNEDKINLTKLLVANYDFSSDEIERLWGIEVGEQHTFDEGWGGNGDVSISEGSDDDHHIMSDEEYEKRYGHPRGVNSRVNFLMGVR